MDSAAWTKTYNYQMFSKGDSLWNLHPVLGYTALVFDDQLWLLGCNRNGQSRARFCTARTVSAGLDQMRPGCPVVVWQQWFITTRSS